MGLSAALTCLRFLVKLSPFFAFRGWERCCKRMGLSAALTCLRFLVTLSPSFALRGWKDVVRGWPEPSLMHLRFLVMRSGRERPEGAKGIKPGASAPGKPSPPSPRSPEGAQADSSMEPACTQRPQSRPIKKRRAGRSGPPLRSCRCFDCQRARSGQSSRFRSTEPNSSPDWSCWRRNIVPPAGCVKINLAND
jgi:hypothetical protein